MQDGRVYTTGKAIDRTLRTALEPLKGSSQGVSLHSLVKALSGQFWQDCEDSERTLKAHKAIDMRFCGVLPRTAEFAWLADNRFMLIKGTDDNGYVWLQWMDRLSIGRILSE